MKLWRLLLIVVVMFGVADCGGGGGGGTSSVGTTGGGTTTVSASPAAGSPSPSATATPSSSPSARSGQAMIRVGMAISSGDRSTVLANRVAIEKLGHVVSPNASMVYWPDQPAVNYVVIYGNQRVVADDRGVFQLMVSSNTPATATLQHPTDARTTASIDVSKLSATGTAPSKVFIGFTYSPCGMTAGAQDICSAPPAKQFPRASIEPNTFVPTVNQAPPTFSSAFGAISVIYPSRDISCLSASTNTCAGTAPKTCCSLDGTNACEQFNGFLTDKGPSSPLWYLGSTCDQRVLSGLCPNENRLSDLEQVFSFASDDPGAADILANPSSTVGNPLASRIHCYENHGGRPCQETLSGELAILVRGQAVHATPGAASPASLALSVSPGDIVNIVVHNNGNWGLTNIQRPQSDLGGSLTCPTQARAGSAGSGPQLTSESSLKHFDPQILAQRLAVDTIRPDPNLYYTDVTLNYSAPSPLPASGSDVITFFADGSYCSLTITPAAPTPTPSNGVFTYSGTLSGKVTENAGSCLNRTSTLSGTITMTLTGSLLFGQINGSATITQTPGICSSFDGTQRIVGQLDVAGHDGGTAIGMGVINGDPRLGDIKGTFTENAFRGTWTFSDPRRNLSLSADITMTRQ